MEVSFWLPWQRRSESIEEEIFALEVAVVVVVVVEVVTGEGLRSRVITEISKNSIHLD